VRRAARGGISDHGISPNERKQQRQRSECHQEQHREALSGNRSRNELLHALDVIDRLIAGFGHGGADAGKQGRVVSGRADKRGHFGAEYWSNIIGKLVEGVIDLRLLTCRIVESVLFDVTDNVHDPEGDVAIGSQ
jgi:hypothetical protein